MIDRVLTKIFGTQHERDIKKLMPRVAAINALEPSIKALSDDALRGKTADFRARLASALEGVHEEDLKRRAPGSWTSFWRRRSRSCGRPRSARSGCARSTSS